MAFLEVAGGALLGGGVSLGTTLLVERRKVEADVEKEDRLQRRATLQALRLVESECRRNLATLVVIKDRESGPWFPPDIPMVTQAWETHESTLALHPNQDLWHTVDSFYAALWAAEEVATPEDKNEQARKNAERICEMAKGSVWVLQNAIEQIPQTAHS